MYKKLNCKENENRLFSRQKLNVVLLASALTLAAPYAMALGFSGNIDMSDRDDSMGRRHSYPGTGRTLPVPNYHQEGDLYQDPGENNIAIHVNVQIDENTSRGIVAKVKAGLRKVKAGFKKVKACLKKCARALSPCLREITED